MDRFDPFVKYADVYGDIINWEKDPMNKPQNQNKYFFSDGKTYYEQICKMLRLMSVFKEAFNQIYSNEDEISEAWENFVNNLSASVVEGSEPDVTLTWTDDSVNFEFTMVPGAQGDPGVGITSISFNSDYTMTITLSDGNTYTSMSLKGETGPQGPQGETGSGLQILDVYATLADLQSAHPTGQPGDAYQVGSGGSYTLYIWSSSQSAWVPAGSLDTVSPSLSNPLMDGTASAGSQNLYSRGDHVHPTDTSRASKQELDALIKTSQSLIDQSFTYRESPAIQDGLARIDKIKGNSLVWNQLVQNGNFASSSGWTGNNASVSIADNKCNVTVTVASSSSALRNAGINGISGHKYLGIMTVTSPKATSCAFYLSGVASDVTLVSANIRTVVYGFVTSSSNTGGAYFYINRNSQLSVDDTVIIENAMFIDLTQMGLNITNPSDFTSLFPLPYYDYNAGTLLSFNGTALKSVSEDESKEDTLTLPVATYFPTGMMGRGTAFDELTNSKAIHRMKQEDLGTLSWDRSDNSGAWSNYFFITILSDAKSGFERICTKYPLFVGSINNCPDKSMIFINNKGVYIRDDSYTLASDFKTAMDGVMLCYELATPTETVINPELDLSFNSYLDGTEQLLPVNGSVPSTSPILADMTYLSIDDAMEYILEKLANVPQNTQQILDALEDDVADLQTDVGALQPAVSALQTSVGNINTNIGQLSSTVAGHTASISDMHSDISDLNTGLSNLEDTVTGNTSRIRKLETGLSATNRKVQNLTSSVSTLSSTVSDQGTELDEIDSIIQDISNNPVLSSLGSHELGFVRASATVTIPANSSMTVTIPRPTIFPNNYTPLFIVGANTGSNMVSLCSVPTTFGKNDSVTIHVYNHGTETTTQVTIRLLCMRQRQSQ